jgi:hypothetical protein
VELGTAATSLAIAGTVVTLAAAFASLPLSLARYRAWRLRKYMETVNALDPERHANQRAAMFPEPTTCEQDRSRLPHSYAVEPLRLDCHRGWVVGELCCRWGHPPAEWLATRRLFPYGRASGVAHLGVHRDGQPLEELRVHAT